MERRNAAALRNAELAKYDKALAEHLDKYGLRRDMDVEELHLDNRDLSELRTLERFRNLNRLWLQSNKLKRVPFLHRCDSITELYLSHNLLQTIENAFRTLVNINVLFLDGNQLTDLRGVADELSFLKFLRNLNLYDNPIALEPNYRKLVIFSCKSLEVFDRNTITKIEKRKSSHLYDPERLQIQQANGFMRCIDPGEIGFLRGRRGPTRSLTTRPYRSRLRGDDDDDDQVLDLDQFEADRVRQSMRRSIKELSHFDWTRVKLLEDEYLDDQSTNVNIFSKKSPPPPPPSSEPTKLPALDQPGAGGQLDKLKSFTGPQVITIRLS